MTQSTQSSRAPVAPARHWVPLIAAWLVVLLPAAWGVLQTVVKSLALFR